MGPSLSRPAPPPLVEISGPRNKILVPAGSAFTFHPPDHRGRPQQFHGQHIHPYPHPNPRHHSYPSPGPQPRAQRYPRPSPFPQGRGRDRGREPGRYRNRSSSLGSEDTDRGERFGHGRGHPRMNLGRERAPRGGRNVRANLNAFRARAAESEDSEDVDLSSPGEPRGMGNGRIPRAGVGLGGMGGGRRGMFDAGMNGSAPELGGYQGMGMGMGMPRGGMGGGVMPPGYGGAGPGLGTGMGMGMPGYGVVGGAPGLGGLGGLGGGGAMGAYPNPYQQQAQGVPMPMPMPLHAQPQPQPQPVPLAHPHPQPRRAAPPGYTAVPMGAFAPSGTPTLARAHSDPPPAAKLNRNKPPAARAGPQGQEWIEGDPFLDACFCTTACTCRKGHRVVYRERMGDGGTAQGEVRYLVKDALGRDCGDHSGCNNGTERERERSGGRKGGKKSEREDRERGSEDQCRAARLEARQGIQRLDEGLADIQAKLDEMSLKHGGGVAGGLGAAGMQTQGLAPNPRQQYPGLAPSARHHMLDPIALQRMATDPRFAGVTGMDPRMASMARQMGGMGQPPGMMDPDGMGFDEAMAYNNPYGGMDEESISMGMMGMDPRQPRGMMGGAPRYMPPRRAGGKGRPPPGMEMFDPRGAPMRGRGGRRAKGGGRRRRPDFGEDDLDEDELDMMRGGGGGGGRGDFGEMGMGMGEDGWTDVTDEDDGLPMRQRSSTGGRPGGRRGGGRPNMGRQMGGRGHPGGRGRHAQVEDEEDERDI